MFKRNNEIFKIVNVLKIFVASHITHNVVNCSRSVMMFTVYPRLLCCKCQKSCKFFPLRTIVRKWVTFYVMMGSQYYYYLSRIITLIITFFFISGRPAYMIIQKHSIKNQQIVRALEKRLILHLFVISC